MPTRLPPPPPTHPHARTTTHSTPHTPTRLHPPTHPHSPPHIHARAPTHPPTDAPPPPSPRPHTHVCTPTHPRACTHLHTHACAHTHLHSVHQLIDGHLGQLIVCVGQVVVKEGFAGREPGIDGCAQTVYCVLCSLTIHIAC